jgi:pyruvate/2-oxoglutarate dehydrogenase complex dihydrolipoamide acyltransferase (E2) component
LKNNIKYSKNTIPLIRQFTFDVGKIGISKHHVRALLELDVTNARQILKLKKNSHEINISFTSWIIKCISNTISEYKEIHGIRKSKNKIIVFDDVDISIMVEKEINGIKLPIPYIIRKANEKTTEQIFNEIESVKQHKMQDEDNYVLENSKDKLVFKIFLHLPQFIRLIIWKYMLRNPFNIKKQMGTVNFTSIGMIGNIKGWILPVSIHPLCFALGSIIKKPGINEDKIEIREYLHMTILFDHDVIDGSPAARFISRLSEVIENGANL